MAVLLASVCSVSLFGQTKARFVSQDGGFSIDLPREGFEGAQPISDLSSGAGSFAWATENGRFTVSYVGHAFPIDHSDSSLTALADAVAAGQSDTQAKVIGRRAFNLSGNPAIELRIERRGASAINRFILVKNILYVLTVDWVQGQNGKMAEKILDSFELVDEKEIVA